MKATAENKIKVLISNDQPLAGYSLTAGIGNRLTEKSIGEIFVNKKFCNFQNVKIECIGERSEKC